MECIALNRNKNLKIYISRETDFLQRLPELYLSCKCFVLTSEEIRFMKSLKMLCLFRNKLRGFSDVSNAVLCFKGFFCFF